MLRIYVCEVNDNVIVDELFEGNVRIEYIGKMAISLLLAVYVYIILTKQKHVLHFVVDMSLVLTLIN